ETTGMVTIPAGEEKTVTSKLIIGFGPTTVTVSAEIPESLDKLSLSGRIFLFYIYVRPGGGI
ncbi:MAG: Zn-dependent exopeptidase M28, partial [Thermoplasmatales archaeon]